MASSLSVLASNHPTQHPMDRLDAARALLGVSPAPQTTPANGHATSNTSRLSTAKVTFGRTFQQSTAQRSRESSSPLSPSGGQQQSRTVSFENQQQPAPQPKMFQLAPPAVISNGLDALAALASSEQASWEHHQSGRAGLIVSASSTASSGSSDDDSEAMPPPPPRAGGRRRSVSNPEGMEKWAPPSSSSRRHFVLPASILEEELAEASAAMEAHQQELAAEESSIPEETSQQPDTFPSSAPISGMMTEEEQANLTPEELLKRARSRLLEDLSEGSLNGEKGVLTLPHSLSKYKEVYNKNGRIGIYTPAERSAIIARFNSKRSRRVWNKKIRYNCRKNLADRRMRVKGRFVKRSTEQQARAEAATVSTPLETTPEGSENVDEDMPDVTDPDAGFCPTEEQPYRRTRRHTIT